MWVDAHSFVRQSPEVLHRHTPPPEPSGSGSSSSEPCSYALLPEAIQKKRGLLEALKQRTHNVVPLEPEEDPNPLADPQFWKGKLADALPEVRQSAIQEVQRDLTTLRKHAGCVTPLLTDEAWFVRRAAVMAVERLEIEPPFALRLLVPRLNDSHEDVREAALVCVRRIGLSECANGARAASLCLHDPYAPVRVAAVSCLGSLEPAELGRYAGAIALLLQDASADVRAAALAALAELDPEALLTFRDAMRSLEDDADPGVRSAAANAGARQGALRPGLSRTLSQSRVCIDLAVHNLDRESSMDSPDNLKV